MLIDFRRSQNYSAATLSPSIAMQTKLPLAMARVMTLGEAFGTREEVAILVSIAGVAQ
tara:strand:- start:324 stop:497 length:174 start_codon:yes stop_codon:yes gene_type:complete